MVQRSAHSRVDPYQRRCLLVLVMVGLVLNLLNQAHAAWISRYSPHLMAFKSRYSEWLRYCQGAFHFNANLPGIVGFCLIFLAVDYLECILALY